MKILTGVVIAAALTGCTYQKRLHQQRRHVDRGKACRTPRARATGRRRTEAPMDPTALPGQEGPPTRRAGPPGGPAGPRARSLPGPGTNAAAEWHVPLAYGTPCPIHVPSLLM